MIRRAAPVVLFIPLLITGCGRMPTISSAIPNWPQSSSETPEETRHKREAEMAIYTTRAVRPPAATAEPQAAPELRAPAVSAAATSSIAGSLQRSPARTFEVAPELIGQPPQRVATATPALASATPAPAASSSGANAARYGDLLFISGQLPVDARGNASPSDARFEDQARLAMENVRSVLESNRLSMANVVSMTVYLRDLNDMRAFDSLYAGYFRGSQPARSIVEVSRLPSNARIEISAVAGR